MLTYQAPTSELEGAGDDGYLDSMGISAHWAQVRIAFTRVVTW